MLVRVQLGELSRPSRNSGGRSVYGSGSRRASRRDRPTPRGRGSLRPVGSAAAALRFEVHISGSESNRGGCSRRPRPTLSNSRALWLTDPPGLTAGLPSGCRSKPSRFRSGARDPAVELSDSLFDSGVVVNPRVEIARPIGTLFITPETGGLLLASADTYRQTCEMSRFERWAASLKG